MSGIGIINWRNNTGTGWVGKAKTIKKHGTIVVAPGDVVVRNARPLRAGLCTGSSDVIGITPVFITEALVGQTVGVFTAVEIKTKVGKPSDNQLNFLQEVKKAGGYAGIAKSTEDIDHIIKRY